MRRGRRILWSGTCVQSRDVIYETISLLRESPTRSRILNSSGPVQRLSTRLSFSNSVANVCKMWICWWRVAGKFAYRGANCRIAVSFQLFPRGFHYISPTSLPLPANVHTSILSDREITVEKSAIIYADNPDTALTTKWLMPNAIRSAIRIVETLMHAPGNKLHNVNARV